MPPRCTHIAYSATIESLDKYINVKNVNVRAHARKATNIWMKITKLKEIAHMNEPIRILFGIFNASIRDNFNNIWHIRTEISSPADIINMHTENKNKIVTKSSPLVTVDWYEMLDLRCQKVNYTFDRNVRHDNNAFHLRWRKFFDHFCMLITHSDTILFTNLSINKLGKKNGLENDHWVHGNAQAEPINW